MLKVLIVTADPGVLGWKSLPEKTRAIQDALGKDFAVVVKHDTSVVKPDVKGGRITHEWMNKISYPLYREGYNIVLVHGSMAQKKKWKIKSTLRGSTHKDDDFVGEAYFFADEKTKRGKYNQFVETCLHEISHVISRGCGYIDRTHEWHDRFGTITRIFKTYDISRFQPIEQGLVAKINELKRIVTNLLSTTKPISGWKVTQPYGTPNKTTYPITGHHIGTDFRASYGEPLVAPFDCKVTRVGYLPKSLGYWCEVDMGGWYMVAAHLQPGVKVGQRLRGHAIANVGTSGKINGVHSHLEGWYEPMDRSKLRADNWRELTFDITDKF